MGFKEGKKLKIVLFRYILIFFGFTATWHNAISQVNIDSLDLLISKAEGKKKLWVLSKVGYYISNIDNNLYYKYSQQGLEESLSQNDSLYVSYFLIDIGYHHIRKGAYQDALNSFDRSKLISEKNNYREALASAYTGLGVIYYELNLYDKALQCHTKSLVIKEELGKKKHLGVSFNNIGLIYYKIDDPVRALEYFKKSLDIKLEIGDTSKSVLNYINIGLAYSEISDSISDLRAKESFRTSIKLANDYNQNFRIGEAYSGLAKIFVENLEYDSAKYFINLSIEESIKNNFKKLESSNYYLLSRIAFQEKEYNLAIKYLERSQNLLYKLNDKSRIKNNYGLYSEIFEAKNMLDSAFYYQKKFSVMKDSIFNEELANNLANVQIATFQEQSQRKIAEKEETISKNKLFSLFLLSILALSIALIVVIFRNYAHTNRINRQLNDSQTEIEAQKENLEHKNTQLADAQVTIQRQNQVLKNINVELDNKVKERTLELDRSNHELEKAVKDLDQFIYKTSHDLRGPIATMQGIINLGVMDAGDEKSIGYFNMLHKVSNKLNNVLHRLIEVHETYLTNPVIINIDPKQEIINTIDDFSQSSINTDITIITDLRANSVWNSDKMLFKLIIKNMLQNALHYKDNSHAEIKVKSEYKKDKLRILFEDNGFGIQEGDEDKVFNIFFKGSPTPGGTGLEIYTAKVAVEKLGGIMKLKKPLKNTIFEIILPTIKV